MNSFLSVGRWLFAIPFALLGLMHVINTDNLNATVAPVFLHARPVWMYLVGAILLLAAGSMLFGWYDKLAGVLLAVFLLLVVAFVHAPGLLDRNIGQPALGHLLKDLGLAGAALLYAQYCAVDIRGWPRFGSNHGVTH
jgi:uncharacterized membrane protein YphA (DoxX/SURF4 family)